MISLLLPLLWGAFAPVPAHDFEVAWRVPEDCADEPALRHAVRALLANRRRQPASSSFVIDAKLVEQRWSLTINVADAESTSVRVMTVDNCADLVAAAALVVAINIDAKAFASDQAAVDVPEPASPTTNTLPPGRLVAESVPAETPVLEEREASPPAGATFVLTHIESDAAPHPRAVVGVAAGYGLHLLPAATPILSLAAGLVGPRWRADLRLAYWFPQSETSSENPAVGGRFSLWHAGVRGCAVAQLRRANLRFPSCLAFDGGAMHGRGEGALDDRAGMSLWLSTSAGTGVRWALASHVALKLDAEIVVALRRPRFRTDPSGSLFTAGLPAFALVAGLEHTFGPRIDRRSARRRTRN